jgi:hypothetical protein
MTARRAQAGTMRDDLLLEALVDQGLLAGVPPTCSTIWSTLQRRSTTCGPCTALDRRLEAARRPLLGAFG